MLRLILFLLLVAIPIAEISLFIVIGGQIGALPTILIIILTAAIGTVLLRRQGGAALVALKRDIDRGEMPFAAIGHAVTVAIAGLLLLTPGFITDAAGFALFMPAVRRWLWRRLSGLVDFRTVGAAGPAGPRRSGRGSTIDLDEDDYAAHPHGADPRSAEPPRLAPDPARENPDSPWNRNG